MFQGEEPKKAVVGDFGARYPDEGTESIKQTNRIRSVGYMDARGIHLSTASKLIGRTVPSNAVAELYLLRQIVMVFGLGARPGGFRIVSGIQHDGLDGSARNSRISLM